MISTGGKLEGVEGFGAGDGLIRALLVCEKFGMGVWRILYIMRYAKAMSSSNILFHFWILMLAFSIETVRVLPQLEDVRQGIERFTLLPGRCIQEASQFIQ